MTLSARNQISGTVASVVRGPVSSLVKIDIGGGKEITASVTTEGVDQMRQEALDARGNIPRMCKSRRTTAA